VTAAELELGVLRAADARCLFGGLMEGTPMPVVQAQLGHASLATTDRYVRHLAPAQVVEAMQRRSWPSRVSSGSRRWSDRWRWGSLR